MKAIRLQEILKELWDNCGKVEEEQIQQMVRALLEERQIFLAGCGRSGLVARAFANRLMHVGLKAYMAGGVSTPKAVKGDLLLILSGSGETESLAALAGKGKNLGLELALLTASPDSELGKKADVLMLIPGTDKKKTDGSISIQPMASAFEQMCWLVCDSLVLELMDKLQIGQEQMYARHGNLE